VPRTPPDPHSPDTWIPLVELEWPEAAAAFNACYAGYLLPVQLQPDDLRHRVVAEAIGTDLSHVVFSHGAPVGVVLVARRGRAARLAALGVAPHRRRSGLGRTMLARAVAEAVLRQDLTLELEVFESNGAALSLYEGVGFRSVDRLLGFERIADPIPDDQPLRHDEPARLAAEMATGDAALLPWQLSPETLARLPPPWTTVSQVGGSSALIDLSRKDVVQLRLIHTPPGRRGCGLARQLMGALAAEAAGRPIRAPQLIPARYEDFAHRLGFETMTLSQRRMSLTLELQ
jgi:ribosomal protein S18 acetylase RimI-like enzyme